MEKEGQVRGINADGFYKLMNEQDGVYLAVFPPQGEGQPVKETDILQDLDSKNIKNYSRAAILKAIKGADGQNVKIAEALPKESDPEIRIIVSADKMESYLQIDVPANCRGFEMSEVLSAVNNAGVVFGIDSDALEKAYKHSGLKVKIAQGKYPEHGANAYIKYYVDLEKKGRPEVLEDGKVDYKNLNLFITVTENQVLAEKIPPTLGNPGVNVLGQKVPAKPGKDIPMPLGKNVKVVDNKIVATQAGHLEIDSKVHVVPTIDINGDVDLSTGNIDFSGNVIVRGSVQEGFYVKAGGNVEIFGIISGATVEGKNVIVRMGIQGMNRGHIKAKEQLDAKYIENAEVFAGTNVIVGDFILHSRVSAGKRILVKGKKGLIIGGVVRAGEEIDAKTVGTQLATATEVEVGVDPLLRTEYQVLRQEIKKMRLNYEQTNKVLDMLKALDKNTLPSDKQEMLLKCTKTHYNLVGQIEHVTKRMAEIEQAFEDMRHGQVKVSGIVYPGVRIVIGSNVKLIREITQHVVFKAEEGDIKISSYS